MAISITLKYPTGASNDNGEEVMQPRTFVATEIKGRAFRQAIEFQKLNEEEFDENTLDGMIGYVCSLFGNRFSVDQFYDGVAAKDMIKEIWRCINAVVTEVEGAASQLPNSPAGKRTRNR